MQTLSHRGMLFTLAARLSPCPPIQIGASSQYHAGKVPPAADSRPEIPFNTHQAKLSSHPRCFLRMPRVAQQKYIQFRTGGSISPPPNFTRASICTCGSFARVFTHSANVTRREEKTLTDSCVCACASFIASSAFGIAHQMLY